MQNDDKAKELEKKTSAKKRFESLSVYISVAALSISFFGLYFQYFHQNLSIIAKVNSIDRSEFIINDFNYVDYGLEDSPRAKISLVLVNTGNMSQYLTSIEVQCTASSADGSKYTLENFYSAELESNVYEIRPQTRIIKAFDISTIAYDDVDADVIGERYMHLFQELNGSIFELASSFIVNDDKDLENKIIYPSLPKCDLAIQLGFLGADGDIYLKTMPSKGFINTDSIFAADLVDTDMVAINMYNVSEAKPLRFDIATSTEGDELLTLQGYDSHTATLEPEQLEGDCYFWLKEDEIWYQTQYQYSSELSVRINGYFKNCTTKNVRYFILTKSPSTDSFYGQQLTITPDSKWYSTLTLDEKWTDQNANVPQTASLVLVGVPNKKKYKKKMSEISCLGGQLEGQCGLGFNFTYVQDISEIKIKSMY